MPVIMYNEDSFRYPPFIPDFIVKMDDVMDVKLHIAHLNESQVYEWLPYNDGLEVPEDTEGRYAFLKGMKIDENTTDEQILAAKHGYAVRAAKSAARHRKALIKKYGKKLGKRIRYAEAFMLSEYGAQPTPEFVAELFGKY
jgi:hypothetical protein